MSPSVQQSVFGQCVLISTPRTTPSLTLCRATLMACSRSMPTPVCDHYRSGYRSRNCRWRTLSDRVAQSSDGSSASQTFNITINDLDEFNVTTPTDTVAATNQVDENVAIGSTVVLRPMRLILMPLPIRSLTHCQQSDGLFTIDANSAITTAAAIDRETVGGVRSVTVWRNPATDLPLRRLSISLSTI